MTIKDFKVGQTVYILGDGRRIGDGKETAAEVVKVGRKYVTISGNWAMQFKETCESRPYLVEHTDYGTARLLFPSREAVDDYIEHEELKMWVRTAAGWEKIDRYTLAQLREVKRILEREGEPEKRVYARTTMETMPGSCNECAFGRRYGCVGDVECRILREYFTGNVEPPYKERPDECPLLEMEETDHGGVAQESNQGD